MQGHCETSKETEKPPKPSAKIQTIGCTMMTARGIVSAGTAGGSIARAHQHYKMYIFFNCKDFIEARACAADARVPSTNVKLVNRAAVLDNLVIRI
jgi:hypothetical protein